MQRYFIEFAYNGAAYSGWQIQPNAPTIQEILQEKMALLLRVPIHLIGAGRTDAGVHAKQMYAHFDLAQPFDEEVIVFKMNRILPVDIVVSKIFKVEADAHARFDATQRIYHYYVTDAKDPFYYPFKYKYHGELDFVRMNEACAILFDYKDFTSFSKLHTDVKTNNCTIYRAEWIKQDEHTYQFVISANRFLRNMVRAIVGTLIEVGRHKCTLDQFRQIIEQKDRCLAGTSVPGNALFLVEVGYDYIERK